MLCGPRRHKRLHLCSHEPLGPAKKLKELWSKEAAAKSVLRPMQAPRSRKLDITDVEAVLDRVLLIQNKFFMWHVASHHTVIALYPYRQSKGILTADLNGHSTGGWNHARGLGKRPTGRLQCAGQLWPRKAALRPGQAFGNSFVTTSGTRPIEGLGCLASPALSSGRSNHWFGPASRNVGRSPA